MEGYWLTFEDGSQGYCEGHNDFDAVNIAEKLTGKKVKLGEGGSKYKPNVPRLPYPASPVIWQFEHPVNGKCPAFCYKPKQCAGRTACPQRHSCTE